MALFRTNRPEAFQQDVPPTMAERTSAVSDDTNAAAGSPEDSASDARERLLAAIERAADFLPAQGPITVFIHHNTLHAYEDIPFNEALKRGSRELGFQPYLEERRYREALARGRISFETLQAELERDLGADAERSVPCFGTRARLRMTMLSYPQAQGTTAELVWQAAEAEGLRKIRDEASSSVRLRLIAETRAWVMRDLRGGSLANGVDSFKAGEKVMEDLLDLLNRFDRSRIEDWSEKDWEGFTLQALWRVCCDGVRDLPATRPPAPLPLRHRDLALAATGGDTDLLVHDVLIRFCGAFLDQGQAAAAPPDRDRGFLAAFQALYARRNFLLEPWLGAAGRELARCRRRGDGPLEIISATLEILGVGESEWDDYLRSSLLALRGWAGMIRRMELRGDRVVNPIPEGSLVEFVAVRLLLDRFAIQYEAKRRLGFNGSLARLREALLMRVERRFRPDIEERAFTVFQLAQVAGITPGALHALSRNEWLRLIREIEIFDDIERRRIFHEAYERAFVVQALDAVASNAARAPLAPAAPRFQLVCCLDEREESLRRYVEEIEPECETYGVAGFFNVPMYFRSASAAHYTPLCPVMLKPNAWVSEEAKVEYSEAHRRSAMARRFLGQVSHELHKGSRNLTQGAIITAALGILAGIPLTARVLFPRQTAWLRRRAGRLVSAPAKTRLRLERSAPTPGPLESEIGFSLDEMAAMAERFLRDIGLTRAFAPIVCLLGHGSSALNNPHKSAYDCGACGGSAGGPNARAMASILNRPIIRERLSRSGIEIPRDVAFIGGLHDTCNDSVAFPDRADLSHSAGGRFDRVHEVLERALEANAAERARRFLSAPVSLTPEEARRHVENRAEDLSQTRPEYGHAGNAMVIVGRRSLSRGLFLDRRAFLASYNPELDDDAGAGLERILSAAVPVCAGINLEYYFSHVDNTVLGSGTKLPHNIASLVGVMDGAGGDLRTGLPRQMVEIHEPMRALFIIETTPSVMLAIMERNAEIGGLCRNGWIRPAVYDPRTRCLSVYSDGGFREHRPGPAAPPRAKSSRDWYRGLRDHLEFAMIEPAAQQPLTVAASAP